MLATESDVQQRMGRPLSDDELDRVPGLIEEASALVEAYIGQTLDPVPDPVVIVTSRMVARVLDTDPGIVGLESTQLSAGSFQQTRRFGDSVTSGGPWLRRADKLILRRWVRRGRAGNVATW